MTFGGARRDGKACRVVATAVATLAIFVVPGRAAPGLTAWQEIAVLTIGKLDAAVAQCGFKLDGGKMSLLAGSADMSLEALRTEPHSERVQTQIDDVLHGFATDHDAACTRMWDTFGPDGQARGFLTR